MAASSARGLRSLLRAAVLWRPFALVGIVGAVGCFSNAADDPCHGPVDSLDCRATFDDQVAWGRAFQPPHCATAGPCGAHLVFRTPQPGLGGVVCVYDNSGQQLLSSTSCSDVPLACGDFCMTGGQSIDLSKECDLSTLPPICTNPDAGM